MRLNCICVLLLIIQVQAQNAGKPQVRAYFDRVDDGPAFFVECLNTGKVAVSSGAEVWPSIQSGTIRVDGVVVPPPQGFMGPGLSQDVAPGQTWRGIIALRQADSGYGPAVRFGALKRFALTYPLKPGRHVIAFQCGGTWSEEYPFYWDDEAFRSK